MKEIVEKIPKQVIPAIDYGIGIANYLSHGFTYIAAR